MSRRRTPGRTTRCSASRPAPRSRTRSGCASTAPQFYLKSRAEMERIFAEVPDSVTNTQAVAEMCDLEIPFPKGSERYPKYPLPRGGQDRSRRLPARTVPGRPEQALRRRLRRRRPAGRAPGLGPELSGPASTTSSRSSARPGSWTTSWSSGTSSTGRNRRGSPVGPGRGSGAGCLVAYLLGITNLDPLRFKLLFERFLNPERVSPPDFDIDFCMRRRGEVIDYVRRKYGDDLRRQHHHLRDPRGEDGDPRRRPGAQCPIRRRRPAGEDDPRRAQHHA